MRALWLVAFGVGCALDCAAADTPSVAVEMRQQAFVPAHIDVAAGTTIVWTNRDTMPHTATADGTFDSGPIAPGQTFRWTAQGSGPIDYRCIFHPSMTGSVNVESK